MTTQADIDGLREMLYVLRGEKRPTKQRLTEPGAPSCAELDATRAALTRLRRGDLTRAQASVL